MEKSIAKKFRELEKKIGHKFKNKKLLELALTHPSFRFETPGIDEDNQRLEFLGDAALGFVSAVYLYRTYEEIDEGDLTLRRSALTSGKALADAAGEIELGSYVRMGKGEAMSGGQTRQSTLADALEAVIGAAYLDGGIKAVQSVFRKILKDRVCESGPVEWKTNPKGKLQEYSQRIFKTQPVYKLEKTEGPAHERVFTSEVELGDGRSAKASGRSKQDAEASAAMELLKHIYSGRSPRQPGG